MICSRAVALSVLAVLAWLVPSLAQQGEQSLPECANRCFTEVLPQTPCSSGNQTCICTNQPTIQAVTNCVLQNCSSKDSLVAQNVTATECHSPVRDRSGTVLTVCIVLGVISPLFVLMRLGHRLFIAKTSMFIDDWLVIMSLIAGVPATTALTYGVVGNGLGKDVWTVPFAQIEKFALWFFITEILYFFNLALMKLILLFFYLRIFPYPGVRRLLWMTVVFAIMFGLTFILAGVFQCVPPDYVWKHWDTFIETNKCINVNAMTWANAGISIGLDIWMLAIPLSQLPGLNIPWKKKIAVAFMFIVGTLVTVLSILRLYSVSIYANSTNLTWNYTDISIWSDAEINVGIICACLPSLRLVLVWAFPVLGDKSSAAGLSRDQRRLSRPRSWAGSWAVYKPRSLSIRLWPTTSRGQKSRISGSVSGREVDRGHLPEEGRRGSLLEPRGITCRMSWSLSYDGNATADGSRAPTIADLEASREKDKIFSG